MAVALVAAACGAGDERLPTAVGADLATRSDLVAARLEAGDGCAARTAAVAMRRDVEKLIASGTIRGEAATELRRRTRSLVRAIECVPPPAPSTPPPPAATSGAASDSTRQDDEDEDTEDEDSEDESDD